jgi:hypothetical protein
VTAASRSDVLTTAYTGSPQRRKSAWWLWSSRCMWECVSVEQEGWPVERGFCSSKRTVGWPTRKQVVRASHSTSRSRRNLDAAPTDEDDDDDDGDADDNDGDDDDDSPGNATPPASAGDVGPPLPPRLLPPPRDSEAASLDDDDAVDGDWRWRVTK